MMTSKHAGHDPAERNRLAIRKTIVLVVLVVLFFSWVGIKIISFGEDLQDQADRYHKSRIEDQARTDRQIAQLACLVVSQTDENARGFDPSARVAIKRFRSFYGCPPYSKATARDPFSKKAQPHPTHPVPTGFVPTDVPGAPATSIRTSADHNPTPTGSVTVPRRTPSAAPRTTPPRPTPSPTPLLQVCPSPLPVLGRIVCVKVG
jgi:hypothetical protein